MLTPMDELMLLTAYQPRTLAIYAGDLTVQICAALRVIMERATDFLKRLALVLQEDLELPTARRKARARSLAACGATVSEHARRLRPWALRPALVDRSACSRCASGQGGSAPGCGVSDTSWPRRTAWSFDARFTFCTFPVRCAYHGGSADILVTMMRRVLRQQWGRLAAGCWTWLAACFEPGARTEPQLAAWTQTLFNWPLMAVDPRVVKSDMQRAWQSQAPSALLAPSQWRRVMGLARADCVASSASAWGTDEGVVLDLRAAAPSTVQQLARQSAVRAMWRRWATTPDSAPELGPPLAALLHSPTARWRLTESGVGAVRSLIAGATWSQARLHRYGYGADGLRGRCWAAPGTSVRRYWQRRESCQPERALALDVALLDGLPHTMRNDPRLARLLVPLSSLPVFPPRDDSGRWHALLPAPVFFVTGLNYTDGYGSKRRSRPQDARTGWGFVVSENFWAFSG
ncbi:unnamed protein product [Prorocentrum cordatum]|uniref:Uncharacterized protein n=1 Tax=Prorocentrum cordatum TaxID=2364126 RepID=A0ABN9PBP4_9DINO|nr:unnamed protein product [Polarella glacialis]